jgi:hypothetical protein
MSADKVTSWFEGRLPSDWFSAAAEITVDREEILVVGELAGFEGDADAAEGRISRFREETRGARMKIADEAERRFGRKVAWGAKAGEARVVFTAMSVPVMTRLRQEQRLVVGTLVDSGVARSRSEALAWCVRLVGKHSHDWLSELREAIQKVEEVRAAGPA